MKARTSKFFFSLLAALPLLVLTGCNEDSRTAMWWMPHPWSTATWFWAPSSVVTGGGNGSASGGSGGNSGGGGGFNVGGGGGYNVGGGTPGVGF